jgi:hypothetical protein
MCEVNGMKNLLTDQPSHNVSQQEKKPVSETPMTDESTQQQLIKGLRIDNMLYCLDTGKEKYLFATEDEAIEQLRKLDKKNINPDNSQIAQVLTTGNTWKLTQVPWSHIAVKLL